MPRSAARLTLPGDADARARERVGRDDLLVVDLVRQPLAGCAPPCRREAPAVRARPRRLRSGRRDASDDEHRRPDLARGRTATPRPGPACGCSRGRRSSRSSSARRCRGSRRPGAERPIQRVPSGLFGPGGTGREALRPGVVGRRIPPRVDLLHDDVEPAGRRRVDRLAGRDREVAPDLVVGVEERRAGSFARLIRITGPMLAAVTSGRTFRACTATGSRELPVSARVTRWRRSLPVERHAVTSWLDPRLAVDEPRAARRARPGRSAAGATSTVARSAGAADRDDELHVRPGLRRAGAADGGLDIGLRELAPGGARPSSRSRSGAAAWRTPP